VEGGGGNSLRERQESTTGTCRIKVKAEAGSKSRARRGRYTRLFQRDRTSFYEKGVRLWQQLERTQKNSKKRSCGGEEIGESLKKKGKEKLSGSQHREGIRGGGGDSRGCLDRRKTWPVGNEGWKKDERAKRTMFTLCKKALGEEEAEGGGNWERGGGRGRSHLGNEKRNISRTDQEMPKQKRKKNLHVTGLSCQRGDYLGKAHEMVGGIYDFVLKAVLGGYHGRDEGRSLVKKNSLGKCRGAR